LLYSWSSYFQSQKLKIVSWINSCIVFKIKIDIEFSSSLPILRWNKRGVTVAGDPNGIAGSSSNLS